MPFVRAARAASVASLASVLALIAPAESLANGRFPAAQLVQLSPDGQSIALRLTFGFALSEDGGRSFSWICEDLLEYGAGVFDPAFTFDQSRRLYVGAPNGLARVLADRCAHDRVQSLEREFVIDLDRSADGRTVLAITSSGAEMAVNRVWRSNDGGETFAPLGAGFGPETLFETVELARSNPQRVYATAVRNSPRRVLFFRSDDGGATLSERSLDAFDIDDAYVAGVDQRDADVVYVRGRLRGSSALDAGPGASPTLLLRTTDGGATFREIARSTGAMNGFALADDGTLWYGSTHPDDGLRRSTDGGQTFERVNHTRVTGLRHHNGTLWVAANWVIDPFALGRSEDGGRTITPVLRTFCDLRGAPPCPPSSDVSALCGARWNILRTTTLACPPAPLSDGAVEPAPSSDAAIETAAPSPTCRCAIPGGRAAPDGLRGLAPWLVLLSLRRRQRPAGR